MDRLVDDRVVLRAEGVSGGGFLELGDGHNVARAGRLDGLLFLALQGKKLTEFLSAFLIGIVNGGIGLQDSGENPEKGQFSGKRVGDRLEDERRKGRIE